MKKIVLLPKTDTVTLCLPKQWVGIPIVCKLTPLTNYQDNHINLNADMEIMNAYKNNNNGKKKKK